MRALSRLGLVFQCTNAPAQCSHPSTTPPHRATPSPFASSRSCWERTSPRSISARPPPDAPLSSSTPSPQPFYSPHPSRHPVLHPPLHAPSTPTSHCSAAMRPGTTFSPEFADILDFLNGEVRTRVVVSGRAPAILRWRQYRYLKAESTS